MKRKILIMTVLLLAVTMLFAVVNTVKATGPLPSADGAVVEVVDSTGTKYYDNLNEALTAAQSGATITLLADINSSNLGSNIDSYHRAVISGNKTITFDFGQYTITSDSSMNVNVAAFVVDGGATVKFEGTTGGITNNIGGGALSVRGNSTVTLKGGNYAQTGTPSDGMNYSAVECVASTLTVNKDVTITADEGSGVYASGTNPTVTIDGATIDVGGFAVSGNGSATTNSTITIKAGTTLTSKNTAAIYHPNTGTLTVEDGTIEGYFGIVSRRGTVNVKGGTITATGTGTATVGDAGEGALPVGAIVTDNKSASYSGDTKVTVTDGDINGAVTAYEDDDNDNDIELIGGTFDEPIPAKYMGNSLEVQKGDTYYLGDNAENALTNAKSGDELSVINGNVNLNGIKNGVKVTNKGTGKVTLNGQEIKTGDKPTPVVNQTELDLADLEDRLAKLEKDLNDEKANADKAKAELEDLKTRVDSLEKENKDLKDRVAKLEEKVAKLEKAQEEQPQTPAEKPSTEGEESGELDDEPKTGDTYAVSAGLVSLLSLAGAVVSKKFIK